MSEESSVEESTVPRDCITSRRHGDFNPDVLYVLESLSPFLSPFELRGQEGLKRSKILKRNTRYNTKTASSHVSQVLFRIGAHETTSHRGI